MDAASAAPRGPVLTSSLAEEAASLSRLRSRVIGAGTAIPGPFGERPLRYFDFIASGRFHRDVEDEFQALLEGVDAVARRGRELAEGYELDDETGEWARRTPAHALANGKETR